MICLIKDVKYQSLLKDSGLDELSFDTYVGEFVEEHGRFPNLDEIPGVNSLNSFKETIQLKENGSTKIEIILDNSNTDSIELAEIKLNDRFRDLDVELLPMQEDCEVNIKFRPNPNRVLSKNRFINQDEQIDSKNAFNKIITTLGRKLGIEIIPITSKQLLSDQWNQIVETDVNAFVYDGKVYLNTDLADVDAPIHELSHIFIGSIRFTNPDLYSQLISSVEMIPGYDELAMRYRNRSRFDVNEEIFVTEFAKYVSGLNSSFNMLDENTLYEIEYNMGRILDTIMMGNTSVRTMSLQDVLSTSLSDLAEITESEEFIDQGSGLLNDATIHRIVNNRKSDLMKNGKLREDCK